jgi:hypothetical protein
MMVERLNEVSEDYLLNVYSKLEPDETDTVGVKVT